MILISTAACLLLALSIGCGEGGDGGNEPGVAGLQSLSFQNVERNRVIEVDLWYPAAPESESAEIALSGIFLADAARDAQPARGGPWPLVVQSHGSGGGRADQGWLASSLARRGFIVAAVEHPGNRFGDDSPEGVVAIWRRPPDVSFVIDQLLASQTWAPRIAAGVVGAAGHSSGGYTALALAGAVYDVSLTETYCNGPMAGPDCALAESVDFTAIDDLDASHASYRDPRIGAAFAMAPAVGQGFDASGLAPIDIPVKIVGSVDDELTLFPLNAEHYADRIRGADLIRVHPGGHFVYMSPCNDLGAMVASQVCVDPDPTTDRRAVHRRIADRATLFFRRHLGGDFPG